jgi:phenylacetate-CoA ligase
VDDLDADLYNCPVRTRYAWQLVRYRSVVKRFLQASDAPANEAALQALLAAAQTQTAYYPGAFAKAGVQAGDLRGLADLAHFPLLSRRTVQARYHDLFSEQITRSDIDEGWLGVTSGSTGEPVRFFMDGESIQLFIAFIRHLWTLHACGPLPKPWQTAIVLLCTLPRSSVYETRLPLMRGAGFRKLHWAERDAASTLQRLNPGVMTGDPASLARLREALEAKVLAVRPKLILSSAFALPVALAEALHALTGATVVDYYSLAETGPVGFRCKRGRFHVLHAGSVVEAVQGEIVITNLRNRLFPLVRYQTGDLGTVTDAACECGLPGRTITALHGRLTERFVDRKGTRVDPSQLQPLLSKLPVAQFRLEQAKRGEVSLVVHGAQAALPPAVLAQTTLALSRLLDEPTQLLVQHHAQALVLPGQKPIVYRCTL